MTLLKSLELWGRRRAAEAFSGISVDETGEFLGEPSKVLVIRIDNRLGNLVLLEPLLRSLTERFPSAEVDVLVSDVFSELLECQGYSVIKVDKKGQIKDPTTFITLISFLRSRCYDVAIDAGHPHSFSLSGAAAAILSGAAARVSTDAGDSPGWYTHTAATPPLDWHESRALHSLGSVWQEWPDWSPPFLIADGAAARDAVGLHVGASGGKRYSRDDLDELVGSLYGRVVIEIYWGTPQERETAEYLGRKYPVAVMPELSIKELIERIAGLRLFISPDNGPMHLASAVSVPVIALFRVENFDRFAPLSPGSRVLFNRDGPDPEAVAGAVLEALDATDR
jgi:heptosyltransferase III